MPACNSSQQQTTPSPQAQLLQLHLAVIKANTNIPASLSHLPPKKKQKKNKGLVEAILSQVSSKYMNQIVWTQGMSSNYIVLLQPLALEPYINT